MHRDCIHRTWLLSLAALALLSVVILGVPSLGAESSLGPEPAQLPPELPAIVAPPRMRPFLSSYRLPDTMTFAKDPVPIQMWQGPGRLGVAIYPFLGVVSACII